jgi:hypothetical protein
MNMKPIAIAASAAFCIGVFAFAYGAGTVTLTKEHVQGAPGACIPSTGASNVVVGTLVMLNRGPTTALVSCSPAIEVSANGATAFGGIVSNTTTLVQQIKCVGGISTDGQGPKYFTKNIMVNPGSHARVQWDAALMGWTTFTGGQVGFTCTLPPKVGVSWVFTTTKTGS